MVWGQYGCMIVHQQPCWCLACFRIEEKPYIIGYLDSNGCKHIVEGGVLMVMNCCYEGITCAGIVCLSKDSDFRYYRVIAYAFRAYEWKSSIYKVTSSVFVIQK